MSGTKRVPIARQASLRITPRAIEIFKQAERARRKRRAAGCIAGMYGYCSCECAPCSAWLDAMSKLHSELKLRPWEWPAIPCCPFPPGSPMARDWEPDGPELELWQTLERARRAALAVSAGAPSASAFGETGH